MKQFLFIFFIGCGFLSGCNPLAVFRPDSEELVQLGWAKHPPSPSHPPPLYCYETLGRTICHSYPLDTQDRLSGYYGPNP